MLKKNNKKIIKVMAVVGLLVFLHVFGFLAWFENGFVRILDPALNNFYSFTSRARMAFGRQSDKRDFEKKLNELKTKVDNLTVENARLKVTEEENKVLREHLRFLTKNDYHYLMANVIARGDINSGSGVTDSILIDRGEKDKIYPGLAVLNSQGIIVGKISETKKNIAKVVLSSSEKCKLAATVLNDEKTAGITEGKLGLTIKMNFIPPDIQLKTDDLVVSSGLEEYIPRGLVIGKIIAIDSKSNELWQTATIEPIINVDNLTMVSVLLP